MKNKATNFINSIISIFDRIQGGQLAGQLSYFIVLSVVPTLTIITYGASFLNLSVNFIQEFLGKFLSKEIVSMIIPIIKVQKFDFKIIPFLFFAFYIASNGLKSVVLTSNTIYGITDNNIIKRRIKALVMTFILVMLFIFILIVPVFGNSIIKMIQYVDLNSKVTQNITFIFKLLKGPVSWFIMFFVIKLIYTMAPDKKISSSYVTIGTLFTSISWIICTEFYSIYINNFAEYDLYYAGLSNIVVLMLWIYLLAFIFVFGMALNYRKEEKLVKTGQIKIIQK